jgi:hypothetical protein
MRCKEKVPKTVRVGDDARVAYFDCGTTGPYGEVCLCQKCEHKRRGIEKNSAAENAWMRSANWGEI